MLFRSAFGVFAAIAVGVAGVVRSQTGVVLDPFTPHAVMVWAPLALVALAALAGVIPAWKAYRTPVAENLTPIS